MKKRQIKDERMDTVLKTMLSEYQEEEGRKILKEAEELNKTDEYAPTKQQIKEFEKISKKQLRKKKIKSLNFKLKVYRTATALGVLLLIFNVSVVSVPAMKEKTLEFFMKCLLYLLLSSYILAKFYSVFNPNVYLLNTIQSIISIHFQICVKIFN